MKRLISALAYENELAMQRIAALQFYASLPEPRPPWVNYPKENARPVRRPGAKTNHAGKYYHKHIADSQRP